MAIGRRARAPGSGAGNAPAVRPASRPGVALVLYVMVLASAAAAIALASAQSGVAPLGRSSRPALAGLAVLLVVAEYLFVRFRYGGETNALNLFEAVLAPLLFAFSVPVVVVTVAVTQLVGSSLRRNDPVKALFNAAQWSLAAGAGGAVLSAAGPVDVTAPSTAALILGAMAIVGLVNQTAFTGVLAIVNGERPGKLLRGLAPVMLPGWLAGWSINSLTGLLFVFAYTAAPLAVALFPVPLVVLHLAYRGYAGARTDRVRLSGLPQAARELTEPLEPSDGIAPFLREVVRCFDARAAALVLVGDGRRTVHEATAEGEYAVRAEEAGTPSLAALLLAIPGPVRVGTDKPDALSSALAVAGHRDCLAAPLMDGGRVTGALMVLDQAGLEGFEEGELAVVDALARETAGAFARGRLLHTVLEERRKLSEIVTTTSDGIFTVSVDGVVRSWNPAIERITGVTAERIVDRVAGLSALDLRTPGGDRVRLGGWPAGEALPTDLRLSCVDGSARRLSCSYSTARSPDGRPAMLIVVARDVTSDLEMEQLRRQFGRLARAEAAQRAVVEQLQEAVMPARPAIASLELGVSYMASDPRAPTGGDLYDWQLLPSGELHVAVVDVLGHGVAATKDALSVVHALRLLALEGVPLEEMVERADVVLGAQNPELVATVVIARYDPSEHRVRLAGGGHPPALHVSPAGGVHQIPVPGGAIGWPGAGSDSVTELALAPGDALLLYTDGLVEANKDIIEGTESLMHLAMELRELPADRLAGGLVHRTLRHGGRRDDSLALVIRREPAVTRVRWTIPPDRDEVAGLRHELVGWLRSQAVAGSESDDLALVATELLSNAVAVAESSVTLRASVERAASPSRATIAVEVEDDGPGRADLDRMGTRPPNLEADAGRGLFIVRRLSDDVTILSTAEGSIVRAVRHVELLPAGRRARRAEIT